MKNLQPNSKDCFVCGVENENGMDIRFYKTDQGEVTACYTVPDQFQGYPGFVHGGILAAILDEVLGRVHMGNDVGRSRFLSTAKMTIRYRKPVPLGKPLRIVGRAIKSKKRIATSQASIYDQDDNLLVEAEGLLVNAPELLFNHEDLEKLGWKIYHEDKESE